MGCPCDSVHLYAADRARDRQSRPRAPLRPRVEVDGPEAVVTAGGEGGAGELGGLAEHRGVKQGALERGHTRNSAQVGARQGLKEIVKVIFNREKLRK